MKPLGALPSPFVVLLLFAFQTSGTQAQAPRGNDVTTPLHLLQPDYPVPYGQPHPDSVTAVLRRVHAYLDAVTPPQVVNKRTGQVITIFQRLTKMQF